MKLDKKFEGNKPAAITKKRPLLKKQWMIIAATIVAAILLILIGLRFWADAAANRFAEEKAAYLTAAELAIDTAAETYENMVDPHGEEIAAASKAFRALQKSIEGSQAPFVQTVWLGQFLSPSFKAASDQAASAIGAREEALKILQEVQIHMSYQQQLAAALHNQALSTSVKDASSAEEAKTAWLAAGDTIRKLSAPARIVDHHQELAERIASVGEQLGIMAELYKQEDRNGLQVANDELAVRLQSARSSAEPLEALAKQLDTQLKTALQKL